MHTSIHINFKISDFYFHNIRSLFSIRDGVMQEMLARLLVPGDLVCVSVGDRVPADIEKAYMAEVTSGGTDTRSDGMRQTLCLLVFVLSG